MPIPRLLSNLFNPKKHCLFEGSDDSESLKTVKKTGAGRNLTQCNSEDQKSYFVCFKGTKVLSKKLIRNVIVVEKTNYDAVVKQIINSYSDLPSWDREGQALVVEINKNNKKMYQEAYNLLSPREQKNKRKVQAVFDSLRREIRTQSVERNPEGIAAAKGNNSPKSILKCAGSGSPLVKKTVQFVE